MVEQVVEECGTCGVVERVWDQVSSCIHSHHSYNGPQAIAVITFKSPEGEPIKLCEDCIRKLLQGTIHGGNYELG